jgi:glycogen(starch) synthase
LLNKKLAIISNLYPPNAYGGYEIATAQVTEGLANCGWDIHVLTSKEVSQSGRPWIYPWLESSRSYKAHLAGRVAKFRYLVARERQNMAAFLRFIDKVQPGVIYFWNTAYTSNCLFPLAKRTGIPVGWFAFDYGLVSNYGDLWEKQLADEAGNPVRKIQRLMLKAAGVAMRRPSLDKIPLDFVHYPTQFLKDFYASSKVQAACWEKVEWGVDERKFTPRADFQINKLLFVGQISHHKGVDLIIDALELLNQKNPHLEYELTIAGHAFDPEYERKLRQLVVDKKLNQKVRFSGFVSREEMPELYKKHGILLFPSVWPEPMGITILEAMSSGLCVLASGTGGSAELYRNGTTAFQFESENIHDLSEKLYFLISNQEIVKHTGMKARESILQKRCFFHTVSQIDTHLSNLL